MARKKLCGEAGGSRGGFFLECPESGPGVVEGISAAIVGLKEELQGNKMGKRVWRGDLWEEGREEVIVRWGSEVGPPLKVIVVH
jgi:hypothetical protein